MRKKNKPVGLVVALGVFVLAAVGINAFQNGTLKLSSGNDPTAGPSRQTEGTATDLANQTKSAIGSITAEGGPVASTTPESSKSEEKKMSPQVDMMLKSRKGRPLMALDTAANSPVYKPKPNDSGIATQWYTSDSRTD